MTPELKVLVFAGAVMVFAYTAIYPKLAEKTLFRMVGIDLALTGAIIFAVGLAYYDTGTAFSLIILDVPWWLFAFICAMVIEAPLFLWFCKKHNIDLNPPFE